MKKLLGYFLCLMITFVATTNVQALVIVDVTGDADPFVGRAESENDSLTAINFVIDAWNNNPSNVFDDDYPLPEAVTLYEPIGQGWPGNYQPITITWEGEWEYLTAQSMALILMYSILLV
jgi:hypothetical protein